MPETVKTSQSGEQLSSTTPAFPLYRGERLETLYTIAIIGIILAIDILAFDIWRDSNLNTRITELERQIAGFEIETSKKMVKQQEQLDTLPNEKMVGNNEENISNIKEILTCFKYKKYWQYEQCFK